MSEKEDLLGKAKNARSADDLLSLAKKNGIDLSAAEAEAYFDLISQSRKTGEIGDNELDSVSGGACYKNGEKIVSGFNICRSYVCSNCGTWLEQSAEGKNALLGLCSGCGASMSCVTCRYCRGSGLLLVCGNPKMNETGGK